MTDRYPGKVVTRQVPFKYTVTALTGIRLEEDCEVSGYIIQVLFHYPDGCNALVDLAFGVEQKWVCPSTPDTYIALNNFTPLWSFPEGVVKVKKGDKLWAQMANGDAVNDHTMSVVATMVGVEWLEESI